MLQKSRNLHNSSIDSRKLTMDIPHHPHHLPGHPFGNARNSGDGDDKLDVGRDGKAIYLGQVERVNILLVPVVRLQRCSLSFFSSRSSSLRQLPVFFESFIRFECSANCPILSETSNGKIIYLQANPISPQQSGTTALLLCDFGSIPIAPLSAFCGVDGSWNVEMGKFNCPRNYSTFPTGSCTSPTRADDENVQCPELTVSNGFIGYDLFRPRRPNTSATLFCNFGFIPQTPTMVNCNGDGDWSDQIGSCRPVFSPVLSNKMLFSEDESTNECPELTVSNGFPAYDLFRPRQSGTSVTLFCDLGYIPNGNTVAFCDQMGSWSTSLGTCNSLSNNVDNTVQCPELNTVADGFIGYDPFRPRFSTTSAILFCNLGFVPMGNTLTCFVMRAGEWNGELGKCNAVG